MSRRRQRADDEVVECPVCAVVCVDEDLMFQPFSCAHDLCSDCVSAMATSGRTIVCPLCRAGLSVEGWPLFRYARSVAPVPPVPQEFDWNAFRRRIERHYEEENSAPNRDEVRTRPYNARVRFLVDRMDHDYQGSPNNAILEEAHLWEMLDSNDATEMLVDLFRRGPREHIDPNDHRRGTWTLPDQMRQRLERRLESELEADRHAEIAEEQRLHYERPLPGQAQRTRR